ncbi:MAG: hypothetical protein M1813_002609 [Trichoglossum hirsutum]|jgi:hypothetical protein|nr:MAG: hypothetical protein M1813_002609 [Trichoglossum hirsutum]
MASSSAITLHSSTRYVIRCSLKEFNQRSHDLYGYRLVEDVIDCASGDFQKVKLLATIKDKKVWIVFDYDVSDGIDNPKVAAFSIKGSIKAINVPAKEVHSRVQSWELQNKRLGVSFPRLEGMDIL